MDEQAGLITLQHYSTIKSELPVEIINGKVVHGQHKGRRQSIIEHKLLHTLCRNRLKGSAWRQTAFLIEEQGNAIIMLYVPDIAYVSRTKIDAYLAQYGDSDDPWRLIPDIAVEVVSPNDTYSEINRKIADYLHYGVSLVWVIDPQLKTVRVHTPADPDGYTLQLQDTLTGTPVLPDWSMPIAELLTTA